MVPTTTAAAAAAATTTTIASLFPLQWRTLPVKIQGGERSLCSYATVVRYNNDDVRGVRNTNNNNDNNSNNDNDDNEDDDELYLIGGWGATQKLHAVVSYNHTKRQWRDCPSLPQQQPRSYSAATAVDNGRYIVVVGGVPSLKSAFLYDTLAQSWSTLPNLAIGRSSPACVAHGHHVYVLGGYSTKYEDTIEILNLHAAVHSETAASWTLVTESRMSTPREACAAVVVVVQNNNKIDNDDEKTDASIPLIVVVGGFNRKDDCLRSCEVFDTQRRIWTTNPPLEEREEEEQEQQTATTTMTRRPLLSLPPLKTGRFGHTLVLVHGRVLVAMGGKVNLVDEYTPTVEALHLTDNTTNHDDEEEEDYLYDHDDDEPQEWVQLPSMETPRGYFAAAVMTTARRNSALVSSSVSSSAPTTETDSTTTTTTTITIAQQHAERQRQKQRHQQRYCVVEEIVVAGGRDAYHRLDTMEVLAIQDKDTLALVAPPHPPPLQTPPPGMYDQKHQNRVETWMRATNRQRQAYKQRINRFAKSVVDGLETRLYERNQEIEALDLDMFHLRGDDDEEAASATLERRSTIEAMEARIAELRMQNDQDERECEDLFHKTELTARRYDDKVQKTLDGAKGFVRYIQSLLSTHQQQQDDDDHYHQDDDGNSSSKPSNPSIPRVIHPHVYSSLRSLKGVGSVDKSTSEDSSATSSLGMASAANLQRTSYQQPEPSSYYYQQLQQQQVPDESHNKETRNEPNDEQEKES